MINTHQRTDKVLGRRASALLRPFPNLSPLGYSVVHSGSIVIGAADQRSARIAGRMILRE
jgi:hypothetical protein